MKDPPSLSLFPEEEKAISDLEYLIGQKLTRMDLVPLDKLKGWEQAYIVRNNHVIGLSIGSCELDDLPKSIGNLTYLEYLWLSNNRLHQLPETFRQLINLKTLYLRNNALAILPNWIGQLMALQVLYLSFNQITSLPDSIIHLTSLKELYLNNNKIISLPKSIGKWMNLTILNLRSNKLIYVPDAIGELTELKTLDLSFNELKSLPESFQNLVKLTELNISYNNFKEIPSQIWSLKNLKSLELINNPWSHESLKVISEKIENILEYCRKTSPIHVFFSYDKSEFDEYKIQEIINFLSRQNEIYSISHSIQDKKQKMDNFLERSIEKSQLFIYFATIRSVQPQSNCLKEIELCKQFNNCVLIIQDQSISWNDLKNIGLQNQIRMDFNKYEFKGFCEQLYEFIKTYKREINVFNRVLAKFERNKMLIKQYLLEIINSPDFEIYYYANHGQINEALSQMGNKSKERANIIRKLFKMFSQDEES